MPELDAMVEMAIGIDGCYGARVSGAGSGVSIYSFVYTSQVEIFSNTLIEQASSRLNLTPQVFACKPSRSVRMQSITDQTVI